MARKSPKRVAAGKKAWRTRQRKSNTRKKNTWTNNAKGHSKAAKKGWQKRKRGAGKKKKSGHRKSPKRVAAGKKAWAKRKRGHGKKKKGHRKHKSHGKKKAGRKSSKRSRAAKKGWRKKKSGHKRRSNPGFRASGGKITTIVKRSVSVKGFMTGNNKTKAMGGLGALAGGFGTAGIMYAVDQYTEESWWSVPTGFVSTVVISELVFSRGLKADAFAVGWRVGGFVAVGVKIICNLIAWASGSKAAMTGVLSYSIDDIISDIKSGKIVEAIKLSTMKGLGLDKADVGLKALGQKYRRDWINDPALRGRRPSDPFMEPASNMEGVDDEMLGMIEDLRGLAQKEREYDQVLNTYDGKSAGFSGYVGSIMSTVDKSLM